MPIIIPKKITQEGGLVIISQKEYKEYQKFLKLQKKRAKEERDLDEAIRIYKKEKREGKLIKINSLADLD